MEQKNLLEKLSEKALELFKKENPEQQNAQVIYKRLSNWNFNGYPIWCGIIAGEGKRTKYYSKEIREKDKLLFLGILQYRREEFSLNYVAFKTDDQIALWENVFRIKVDVQEKKKQVKRLRKLIEEKLSQLTLADLFNKK